MSDQTAKTWDERVAGHDCPFDEPRGDLSRQLIFVSKMKASTLYLERNQTYRGYCVLVYDPRHVARIDQLTTEEWQVLASDIHRAESAIFKACAPAHMNVASLGNAVPHVHWHLIPRYVDDPRWGDTIWSPAFSDLPPRTTLSDEEYQQVVSSIAQALTLIP